MCLACSLQPGVEYPRPTAHFQRWVAVDRSPRAVFRRSKPFQPPYVAWLLYTGVMRRHCARAGHGLCWRRLMVRPLLSFRTPRLLSRPRLPRQRLLQQRQLQPRPLPQHPSPKMGLRSSRRWVIHGEPSLHALRPADNMGILGRGWLKASSKYWSVPKRQ